jgi:hypothetical protein
MPVTGIILLYGESLREEKEEWRWMSVSKQDSLIPVN